MTEKTLTDLFEEQRKLDAEIERKHPTQLGEDRTAKKLLALSVELGECANEWRGFKFWSENQKSNTYSISPIFATEEDGTPYQSHRETNPLLEEYIDCLHFALSIGNEYTDRHGNGEKAVKFLGILDYEFANEQQYKAHDITVQYIGIFNYIGLLSDKTGDLYSINYALEACKNMINYVIGLGEMLGFAWEQVVNAYEQKNAVNYKRQESGY